MTSLENRLTPALAEHYAIERELGRGGMATVYLAQDLRHHRQVAIKVLHPELSRSLGAERFLREIEIAARLTHPHILPLYDSGEADGLLFYVMPFVEGESLRGRLDREGPLPVVDAVRIARGVAGALGHAHEHGIVHRDIKPENILLASGEPVVADFGIARAVTAAATPQLTSTGIAIGTPAYMSPEQAAADGKVDGRSDLYSLGCLMYEMLAGEPPYTGPSAQAITAKKLTEPIPALRSVRPSVTPQLEQLIATALARSPADRFATAGLLAAALDRVTSGTVEAGVFATPTRAPDIRGGLGYLPWAITAVAVIGAAAVAIRRPRASSSPDGIAVRLALATPAEQRLITARQPDPVRLTPDGQAVVYLGRGPRPGTQMLYLRRLDDPVPKPIGGTEGARAPFVAPDGQSVGYFVGSQLRRVALAGGEPVVLADPADAQSSATWSEDGWIYYVARERLTRVPVRGGSPETLTGPQGVTPRVSYPYALPNGRGVLFVRCARVCDSVSLHLIELPSLRTRELQPAAGRAWYLPTGHLAYRPSGSSGLVGVPFDLARLAVTGQPVPLLDHVAMTHSGSWGDAVFDIARNGTAIYLPGEAIALRTIVRHQPDGRETPLTGDHRQFLFPRISPDGRYLATEVHSLARTTVDGDIWIYDLQAGNSWRLAAEGHATRAAWSPDGRRIAFSSWISDTARVYTQPVDGGPAVRLDNGRYRIDGLRQVQWSADGRWVFAAAATDSLGPDIVALSAGPMREPPRVVRRTPAIEAPGPVSPDGRWMSYVSNETGRQELYLQPLDRVQQWPISTDGASDPMWPRWSPELYFRTTEGFFAVRLELGATARVTTRRQVPIPDIEETAGGGAAYDLLPGGDVVLIRTLASDQDPIVILNWSAEIRRRLGPR